MIKNFLSLFKNSSNSFEGQENGEQVLLIVRQHPFIIIVRVGMMALTLLIPIAIGIEFGPYLSAHSWLNLFLFVSSIWYLFVWMSMFYTLTLYSLRTVIITNHRIIDNNQCEIFNRRTSALHSNRIQDVTSHTNGVIETFLKFGNVTVQTAASEKQFIFKRVPDPDEIKDLIMRTAGTIHSGIKANGSKSTLDIAI